MSPEKCSYIFYSGNPSKNYKLNLKLFGKQISYTDSPVFLGIKFDQSLCFNSQVEFVRSRCHDRTVEFFHPFPCLPDKHSKTARLGIRNRHFRNFVKNSVDFDFLISKLNKIIIQWFRKFRITQYKAVFSVKKKPYLTFITNLANKQQFRQFECRVRLDHFEHHKIDHKLQIATVSTISKTFLNFNY
ncbi:hypothetical protein BpHYR1_053699 [Brachionus plicatilis]|uniref:RNA-directed DNA polymerase from mobile element jockey-like n=1 Tax=Brachionus plicatilis TaxID=10195 RepID=A0A3M7PYY7_BRAPC|nr:hypothetical protein BpHYR1_053699 [Brachionus plicatilis]